MNVVPVLSFLSASTCFLLPESQLSDPAFSASCSVWSVSSFQRLFRCVKPLDDHLTFQSALSIEGPPLVNCLNTL